MRAGGGVRYAIFLRRGHRPCARSILSAVIGVIFGLSITMCLRTLTILPTNNGPENDVDCAPFASVSFLRWKSVSVVSENEDGKNRLETVDSPPRHFLFVGVMTAQKYVDSRAYEIHNTWAKQLAINGSVAFFVRPEMETIFPQLPLVRLPGVDDSYPPQKKSFAMLKYWYENYADQYEWFLRADDDVYVRLDKLEVFLRSLNSSRPMFVGQAGLGTPEEYGQLSLGDDENYCMGGPGIILSRETLLRIGPHIDECVRSMVTTHEDVEVGRCVKRFAGVTCTWSYEMQTLFYNNKSGTSAYSGDLNVPEVIHSISLHPIKQSSTMRQVHNFVRKMKLADLRFRSLQLHRDILMSTRELQSFDVQPNIEDTNRISDYASTPSLTKFIPSTHADILTWTFLSPLVAFCTGDTICPRHNVESYWRYATSNVIRQVLDIVNKYARQRGRILEFQDVLYGYRRVDPLHGVDYILDLLLLYKKFKGRRVTIPVRRHAYLQQSFADFEFMEENTFWRFGQRNIDESNSEIDHHAPIYVILPICGRPTSFRRFLDTFERLILKNDQNVKLYVVQHPSGDFRDDLLIRRSVLDLQDVYAGSQHEIHLFQRNGSFSRGAALNYGASQCPAEALMFFTDVDVEFGEHLFRRLRSNTVRGKQVYFPIVFSRYSSHRTLQNGHTMYDSESGYFRHFGYGLAGMYKSDFDAVGGFDEKIHGWGMEDVDLFDRFLKKQQAVNVTIFRAPEPDLVHVYHPIYCNKTLSPTQYEMCLGTKAASLAGVRTLADMYFSLFSNTGAKNHTLPAR